MKWRVPADRRLVEAIIATFSNSPECSYERLSAYKDGAWLRSYYWLDASGMTLYFLDHINRLGITDALPSATLARFQQNFADNHNRSSVMHREFVAINKAFQQAGVLYSNLKGFTLSPESCPDPALRSQLDLDFLVDGDQLDLCREILSESGYVLSAATGKTWEFKAGASELAHIDELYKPKFQRSVELHFASSKSMPHRPCRDERLNNLSLRSWSDHTFPVLSSRDQFIGQALHLFGHICSPFTRLAWLLEYKRHLATRDDDQSFWDEVRQQSRRHRHANIAIGLCTLFSSRFFGGEAPAQLNEWTLDTLPASVKLWADQYGRRSLFADFPGTKLYLILLDQLSSDNTAWQKKRSSLLPLRPAPRIALTKPDDKLRTRLRGEVDQLRFILFRLRFHIIEGLRYVIESMRWKRRIHILEHYRMLSPTDKSSLTKANVS